MGNLPETDVETDVSEEDDDKDELEVLVKEALEELPEDLKDGKHKMRKVVSPVKVTLTPSKEGNEDPQGEILTLDSEEEEPAKERPPALWVRELLLTEQPEEYDSGEDPEFVPPPVIYETDREYDEYSDGGDKIPEEEVKSLLSDEKTTLAPPSTYIPIWIPVNSPAEKVDDDKARAAGDVAEFATSGVVSAKLPGKETKTPEKTKIDNKAKAAGDVASPKGVEEVATSGVAAAKSPGKEGIKAKTPEKGKKSPMKKVEAPKEAPEKAAKENV